MTKHILAYAISGHDNNSYMLGEETRRAETDEEREFFDWRFVKDGKPHPAICSKCGRKIEHRYIDHNFKLRKKRMDISSTYDGYTIVSEDFKTFCEGRSIASVEFVPLPSQPKHYWFVAQNILEVDLDLSVGLRFLYPCDRCESYAGVFGTSALRFKNVTSPISDGIYRTDLEFAQAHQQAPVIVVGTEVASAIKARKFKGTCLNAILCP